jgi:hypothetical protein
MVVGKHGIQTFVVVVVLVVVVVVRIMGNMAIALMWIC